MSGWHWLSDTTILALHQRLLSEFGGAAGLRDVGLFESALARPLNKAAHTRADVFELAAAYCFGLVRNHAFVDGNKRIGFAVSAVFLSVNGYRLDASETDALKTILALAAGELSEEDLTRWFRKNCVAIAS